MRYKIKRMKKYNLKKQGTKILYYLLVVMTMFLFTYIFTQTVGGYARVYGISMEPQLKEGDRLIYWKPFYQPQRGDVVICRTGKGIGNELVKRVIGLSGDEIDIDNETGTVYVNGNPVSEPYIKGTTYASGDIVFPVTVPQGQYFVMGDNRESSLDSRYSEIGMVEREKIDGHILIRFFPFTRIGRIE